MDDSIIIDRVRKSFRSVKSTDDTAKVKKNYGTLTERDEQNNFHRNRFEDASDGSYETTMMNVDTAMNKIKLYKLFFFIGIIPMILSFSFSDLIVDSLNFLELIPGLEWQTTSYDANGESIWMPCSKHNICDKNSHDEFLRKGNGEAIYRNSEKKDYYSLQNWVESMDIECKNKFQIGALGSVSFVGMAVGSLIFAILSEKYGRKIIYIGGLITTTLSLIVVLMKPSYYLGLTALFIYGVGVFPRMTIGYVYALELTPEGGTKTLGMLMFVGECFTIIVSNLYLVAGGRDALFFVWASTIFSLIPLLFSIILPESPKYLYDWREYEKTKESLQRIATLNNQNDVDFTDAQLEHSLSSLTEPEKDNQGMFQGLYELWKDKESLKNTLILAFFWGFYTFGHHCLLFMLKYVPGNKFTIGLLVSIGVTIAPILTRIIQYRLTSKQIFILFSLLWACFSAIHIFSPDKSSYNALFMIVLVAVWIDAIGFTNYYVEFEYFNPKIATIAYGIWSMTGRTAAIFAPLVVEEFDDTIVIFLVLSIIASIIVWFINKPEEEKVKLMVTYNHRTKEVI